MGDRSRLLQLAQLRELRAQRRLQYTFPTPIEAPEETHEARQARNAPHSRSINQDVHATLTAALGASRMLYASVLH